MKQYFKENPESFVAYANRDDWGSFGYSNRYLDAIASLFHVQTDVIASVELDDIIYLSYNADLNKVNKLRASFIRDIIADIGSYSKDDLLGVYLLFNMDFIDLAKKTRNHVDIGIKDIIESFSRNHEKAKDSLDKNLKKVKSSEELKRYTVDVVLNYKDIIKAFSTDHNLKAHLFTFLRPLQDSYKLYTYLNEDFKYKNIKDVIVLDNPNNIHADSNLAYHFSNGEYLSKNYMGVSKLCCGYCHNYLSKNHYEHRGTHGVCDDKWKMPWPKEKEISPIEPNFKKSVNKIADFDQKNPPPQHRKLSYDFFEKDIQLDEKNTLCKLKCDLLGSHNYDIADEYGYYIFTGDGYIQIG